MNIGNKIKIISIVSSCIILDVFLHMLTAPFSTMPDNPNLSFVAKSIGVEAAATFWAFLAFSVVNFVFLRFRERIPGEGVRKGLFMVHQWRALGFLQCSREQLCLVIP